MKALLYRLLNLDPDLLQGDSTWSLVFGETRIHPAVALAGAAALGLLVLWLYRRETRHLSRGVRAALTALRALLVLAVFGAAFSPALMIKTEKRDKSHVLLLADQSSSMLLKDHYDEADRQGVSAALEACGGRARSGAEIGEMTRAAIEGQVATYLRDRFGALPDYRVAVYSFGERLQALDEGEENGRKKGPVRIAPSGDRTEMGTALMELLQRFRGQPVSAVVVLSDGRHNAGFLPSSAADMAREQGVPVYTLGIGNPKHPRDIQVGDLIANDTLLVNDPAEFTADVRAWGYAGNAAAAEAVLYEQGEGVSEREVARKTIRLLPDGERVTVRFEYTPEKVGEKTYRVEVAARQDEARVDNNTESVTVNVVEATLRVLYVSFEPTWEYRVLSRALIQDKMIHAACWLQAADPQFTQDGDESLDKLPDTLDMLVRREKMPAEGVVAEDKAGKAKEFTGYDVVILSGIDPSDVKDSFTDAIVRFVRDHGGGLLFVAGKKMTPYMLKNSRAEELLTLLPVEIEDKHDTSNYGKRLFSEEFRMQLTPEAAGLRMVELGRTPEETKDVWEKNLPGFFWHYPVRRAKPGAVVVAVHDKDKDLASRFRKESQHSMPLVAWHFFGKGRVMYVGVDSTWRWRKDVADKYFYKFWSQALHYLGKGSLLKKLGGVTITTDKPEYVVSDMATIQAKVSDEKTLEPSSAEKQTVVIQKVGLNTKPEEVVLAGTQERGRYEGTWKAREMGSYQAWLRVDGKKEDERPGLHKFEVQLPAREMGDLRIDEKTLAGLAVEGGAFLAPADLGAITKIPDRVRPVAEARVVQRSQTVWDSKGALLLLLALPVAEWILRKKKGLT